MVCSKLWRSLDLRTAYLDVCANYASRAAVERHSGTMLNDSQRRSESSRHAQMRAVDRTCGCVGGDSGGEMGSIGLSVKRIVAITAIVLAMTASAHADTLALDLNVNPDIHMTSISVNYTGGPTGGHLTVTGV